MEYPLHPGQTEPHPYYVTVPMVEYEALMKELYDLRNSVGTVDGWTSVKELPPRAPSFRGKQSRFSIDCILLTRKPFGIQFGVYDFANGQWITPFNEDSQSVNPDSWMLFSRKGL